MAVKMISVKANKELHSLSNVDPEFVSLVRHGANRQGFRVVKGDQEGGRMPGNVIHSVLVPSGRSLSEVAQEKDCGWVNDLIPTEGKAKGDYVEFQQAPTDRFKADTLQMRRIGDSGALAVVGEVEKQVEADVMVLPDSPDTKPIASVDVPPMQFSFRDLFFKELDAFLSTVEGTMSQSSLDAGARKKAVMNAHKAFGGFLTMALDALNKVSSEKADVDLSDLRQVLSGVAAQNKGGSDPLTEAGGFDDMFKDKDEAAQFIAGAVRTELEAHGLIQKEEDKVQSLAESVKALNDQVAALTAKLESSESDSGSDETEDKDKSDSAPEGDRVKALEEKMDKIMNSLSTDSQAGTEEDAGVEEKDKSDESEESGQDDSKEYFRGLLFDWPAINQALNKS